MGDHASTEVRYGGRYDPLKRTEDQAREAGHIAKGAYALGYEDGWRDGRDSAKREAGHAGGGQ